MPTPYRVVLVTAPGPRADGLAKGLIEARLAACVNVLPGVVSHYRWQGRLCRDPERLLIIKTSKSKLKALERWVKTHHAYTVPEIISLPIEAGSREYLSWVADSTR